jgi:hypothetical protein
MGIWEKWYRADFPRNLSSLHAILGPQHSGYGYDRIDGCASDNVRCSSLVGQVEKEKYASCYCLGCLNRVRLTDATKPEATDKDLNSRRLKNLSRGNVDYSKKSWTATHNHDLILRSSLPKV